MAISAPVPQSNPPDPFVNNGQITTDSGTPISVPLPVSPAVGVVEVGTPTVVNPVVVPEEQPNVYQPDPVGVVEVGTPTVVNPVVVPEEQPNVYQPDPVGATAQVEPVRPIVLPVNATSAEAAGRQQARAQAQIATQRSQANQGDWRVKLQLAGDADYLYRAAERDLGILAPLAETDGVVFPYMPDISTNYVANYNNYDLTHSNYRGYFYQNSQVSEISITAMFTAQDTREANYLLAVIQFFKSVTKMFYGQDSSQYRGSPPPLVFLQGLGQFQFNLAPCVVNNFNYVLPSDVDYIRARVVSEDGTNLLVRRNNTSSISRLNPSLARLQNSNIPPGATYTRPPPPTLGTNYPTYVPTKMQIALTLLPVQTRSQVSTEFSLEQFANGSLIQRGFW
jgi:hypothetical protein